MNNHKIHDKKLRFIVTPDDIIDPPGYEQNSRKERIEAKTADWQKQHLTTLHSRRPGHIPVRTMTRAEMAQKLYYGTII